MSLSKRFPLIIAGWVAFIFIWDSFMMHPVLPIYAKDLGASTFMVGLIMGVFSITNCIGNVFFGRMADIKGRKLPLVIGFFGAATIVIIYSQAAVPVHLLVLRFVHGFFAGAIGPISLALFADLAPPERRGAYMGIWSVLVSLGVAIASPLGGFLATTYGYLSVWLTLSLIFVITGVVVWTLLPKIQRRQEIQAESEPMAKPSILSILKRRNVVVAYYGIFAMYFMAGTAVTLFTLYLADLKTMGVISVDPKMAFGMLMGTFGVAAIFLSYLFGRLSDAKGRKILLIIAFMGLTATPLLISNPSVPMIVISWIAAYGIAFAILYPSLLALLTDELAPHERGVAMGLFMVCLTAGTGVAAPLMGYIGGNIGLAAGIKVAAIIPAIAVLGAVFIHQRPPRAEAKFGTKSKLGLIIGGIAVLAASYPLIMYLQA